MLEPFFCRGPDITRLFASCRRRGGLFLATLMANALKITRSTDMSIPARRTSALLLIVFLALCLFSAGCQKTTARGQYDIAVGGSSTK